MSRGGGQLQEGDKEDKASEDEGVQGNSADNHNKNEGNSSSSSSMTMTRTTAAVAAPPPPHQ
jgi:hypothetical protein